MNIPYDRGNFSKIASPKNSDISETPGPLVAVKALAPFQVARITMPKTYVRLSAGRDTMNDEMQALCFFAGANSIFYGDELLTTKNSSINHDKNLLDKLRIKTI